MIHELARAGFLHELGERAARLLFYENEGYRLWQSVVVSTSVTSVAS